jgi:site-specific DNA-methyltransferase (adenine-specific)
MSLDRDAEFRAVMRGVSRWSAYKGADYGVVAGDSLEVLRAVPDHSVGLILTDPPYHTTKKKNIVNDTAFGEDRDFLGWIAQYVAEWKRVLRPNGSLFMFCSSEMSARLEALASASFNVLSSVVWTKPNEPGFDGWKQKMKKEALRQWYAHTERIIFAEPAFEGNLGRSYFANFMKKQRQIAGISTHDLAEITGFYGKVNHGGTISNWEAGRNIPSKEQYQKVVDVFLASGKIQSMPEYENIIRPFMVNSSVEFTDVWNFSSVRPYKGKHPAEKPLDLLKHAIMATTYEHDIVLDCFSGSGNTGIAALSLNRKAVMIEIDPVWARSAAEKLSVIGEPEAKRHIQRKNYIKLPEPAPLFQNFM